MIRMVSSFVIAGGLATAPLPALGQAAGGDTNAPKAVSAKLKNAKGADVGQAELRQTPKGILLRVQLKSLPPGTHAMHVHETGRCDAPDFKSAGAHFAPGGSEHGFLDARGPHAGDLPNVHIGTTGESTFELFVPQLTLGTGAHSLLDGDGSALVIHADADDYHADPGGDAGNRIACGVIAARS
jgi:Cu-Zn family superoxide dismutase